jgi:hypothetical protein
MLVCSVEIEVDLFVRAFVALTVHILMNSKRCVKIFKDVNQVPWRSYLMKNGHKKSPERMFQLISPPKRTFAN